MERDGLFGFLDFEDMIDGGGAGQVGQEFEGGGILSMLANAIAKPLGYEDRREAMLRMANARPAPRPTMPDPMPPRPRPRPDMGIDAGDPRRGVMPTGAQYEIGGVPVEMPSSLPPMMPRPTSARGYVDGLGMPDMAPPTMTDFSGMPEAQAAQMYLRMLGRI